MVLREPDGRKRRPGPARLRRRGPWAGRAAGV